MLQQLIDRFTTTSLVGVDLGSTVLKVVELARRDEHVILRHCAVASIENRDATQILKQLVTDGNVTTTHAALAVAAPEVIAKSFQAPAMPDRELRNAIQLEAEQAMLSGHAMKEMALDWHMLPGHSRGTIRGVLSVVPKTAVAARAHIAQAAGLRPVVMDVEGLALWNAYWMLVGSQDETCQTVLLMDIGVRTTNIVIARGPDELMLVRDVQLGGKALSDGQGQEWIAEVRDSLGYARAQGGLRSLDAIYVTGGGSAPHVVPLLKSAVPAPLTFWNPLNQLVRDAESPAVEETVGPLLAIAIGLALRHES